MPGLEPRDISDISGDAVTIKGVGRGVGQHRRDLLIEEWTIGPYEAKVSLPQPVDGALTNATYGNGVLVLAAEMKAGERGVSSTLHVDQVGSARASESAMQVTTYSQRQARIAFPPASDFLPQNRSAP